MNPKLWSFGQLRSQLKSYLISRNGYSRNLGQEKRKKSNTSIKIKDSLYNKINPLGDEGICIKPEIDKWVDNGNKASVIELSRIFRDFRKQKRFTHALQVSEWMHENKNVKFTPTKHAIQLDLIGRVRGFLSAEKYFNSLKDVEKGCKTYGALFNCFVQGREIDKALAHLEKMKEMGFANRKRAYNGVMLLYTNTKQYDKIPDVLAEMKQNKVTPDNYSYRLCMNSYAARFDLEAVENCLKDAETQPYLRLDCRTYAVAANFYVTGKLVDKAIAAMRKAEKLFDYKDTAGYNFLISLYAKLGEKDKILRLWRLKKKTGKCFNRDYITVLESLVKVDALDEAENVLKEWESSENIYDFRVPNIVILGYLNKGLLERAEAMLNELLEKGKSCHPGTWALLAASCQEKDEMHKAMISMRVGLSFYVPNKGWKPNEQIIGSLLGWIGDNASVEDAESFVKVLKTVTPVNRPMYHTLLKAYIRNGSSVDELLVQMKAEKVEEDEQTKMILRTIPEKV